MSNLLSTPHTWSECHSLVPVARNIAGIPTLGKQDQEEFLLNDTAPFTAAPKQTTSPALINLATFQQQMFNMMSLLTESVAGQQTRREAMSLSTHDYGKEPQIKDPGTFSGNCESLKAS